MGPEDFGKFAETLSHVAKLYGVRLTDEKVSLFFDACRSLSPEQFAVGIKRHVKRGKFFPSPSECLRHFSAQKKTRQCLLGVTF